MTDDISNRTDQAPEDIVEPAAPPDRRRWLALAVIGMAQLMVILDASIVNIALPSAQAELGISDADRQWVLTAYTLAFGGLLLLGGRIADYWGRKRTFLVGLLGFAAASALGGIAPNAGCSLPRAAFKARSGRCSRPRRLRSSRSRSSNPRSALARSVCSVRSRVAARRSVWCLVGS